MSWMLLTQATGPDPSGRLETIMWAQVTMAAVMVICLLAVLAVAIGLLLLVRTTLRRVDEARNALLPHVTPILSRASGIADDVRAVTAGFRHDADAVHETVDDVVERARRAIDALDERVRRFGLVLEAVQEQAEELMMDAAATAHGVHAAARALREDPPHTPAVSTRRRVGRTPEGQDEA